MGKWMSDEFVKTVVLDRSSLPHAPVTPAVPAGEVKPRTTDDASRTDADTGLRYPAFEDTSWLT